MRDLLSSKNHWIWGDQQAKAFTEIKNTLGSSQVLGLYNPSNPTIVSTDTSSFGLGAVLKRQQPNGDLHPIAFIFRSLTDTEKRIENEALAVTWACERFQDYLIGLTFSIETNHKPLVPLLSAKNLDELPLRVQRFCLRMMRFNYFMASLLGLIQ